MNYTWKYGWIGIALLLSSCSKNMPVGNPDRPSILQYIAKTPSLSILQAAIQRVRLDTVFGSGGPFTFFAPADAAFLQAGLTMDSVKTMDVERLLLLLEYQVINGRISGQDIQGFFKSQFTSLHPLYQPFITKNYFGIYIDGTPVINKDIELGDGVVQVTGRVTFPPPGNLLRVLEVSKDMLFFAALGHQVSLFNRLLNSPTPYVSYYLQNPPVYGITIFIPTDSAFRAFGYADSTALVNDSTNLVGGVFVNGNFQDGLLINYIFSGFNFTSDYLGGVVLGPYLDVNIGTSKGSYQTTSDGRTLIGNGLLQTNPPRIIQPDIMASSGVIQKVNQVFVSH